MALMLTTRPRQALALTWPRAGYLAAALLLLPLAELAHYTLQQIPQFLKLLDDRRIFVAEDALRQFGADAPALYRLAYLLVLSLLPALGQELAFRGLILTGLRRSLATWPAILLSSFLFAAYHMNVFALAPLFVFGVALGWFAVRSGSLLPGVILHAGSRLLLLSGPLAALPLGADGLLLLLLVTVVCTALSLFLLWRLGAGLPPMSAPPVPTTADSHPRPARSEIRLDNPAVGKSPNPHVTDST
jgi:membrane protease YdiL (CAAX protease family)